MCFAAFHSYFAGRYNTTQHTQDATSLLFLPPGEFEADTIVFGCSRAFLERWILVKIKLATSDDTYSLHSYRDFNVDYVRNKMNESIL